MRRPTCCFQPGITARYACTGASPLPFAICGLPPESELAGFLEALVGSKSDGFAILYFGVAGLFLVRAMTHKFS